MTSRLAAPDTPADEAIRAVLDADPLTGFTVVAGAGSGKTTSLVKALDHVTRPRGPALRAEGQKVACITYTVIAANEIHEEIGRHQLAEVATIHSFLWSVIKPFQRDIGTWVRQRTERKLDDLLAKPKGTAKYASEVAKYEARKAAAEGVVHWDYGFGHDYGRGRLGHAEVIEMVPQLIMESDLLARVVARRFPFILVDESQDAFPRVIDCLHRVWDMAGGRMCLGFFGDPMQQIYPSGVKDIALRPGWVAIEKPENFRSSRQVLACVNAVRTGGGDTLHQESGLGDDQAEGEAFCFVLPADDERTENHDRVRRWLDEHSQTGQWTGHAAKVLNIEHRIAADRLGFPGLHAAFRKGLSGSGLKLAFDEGQAWPLAPVTDVILPLCSTDLERTPATVALLREYSPLLRDAATAGEVHEALNDLRLAVVELRQTAQRAPGPTIGELLRFAVDRQLIAVDPRLAEHLAAAEPADDETGHVLAAVDECLLSEMHGYVEYVTQRSPYATHQGTKGAEFERVLVVLDDADSKHAQFSYDKLLGLKPLSDKDEANMADGKDSTIERTRRLLYVCLSRARIAVAVVLYATDVDAALAAVSRSDFGPHVRVVTEAELGE
jgi:DNA helicase-2/ATP-dependent DNA helicase PcrA